LTTHSHPNRQTSRYQSPVL